jgi:hypothetical protein
MGFRALASFEAPSPKRRIMSFLKIGTAIGLSLLASSSLQAQKKTRTDPVTYNGVVLASGSLQAIPGVTVSNRTTKQQAQTNEYGRFEITVQAGDTILFSHVGFEGKSVALPQAIEEAASVFILSQKGELLPMVTVRGNPTSAEFQRDFVKKKVPVQAPMKFWDSSTYVATMNSVSGGAQEAGLLSARARADAAARTGMVQTVTLVNFFELRKLFRKKKKK